MFMLPSSEGLPLMHRQPGFMQMQMAFLGLPAPIVYLLYVTRVLWICNSDATGELLVIHKL